MSSDRKPKTRRKNKSRKKPKVLAPKAKRKVTPATIGSRKRKPRQRIKVRQRKR